MEWQTESDGFPQPLHKQQLLKTSQGALSRRESHTTLLCTGTELHARGAEGLQVASIKQRAAKVTRGISSSSL